MASMQGIIAFAETVKCGGFASASRELGLSPSTIAKSVARLEAELGLRLLHRTTRRVTLTTDGSALYERCQRIVGELDALHASAEDVRGEPSGTLRLDMPITYGKKVLVPLLVQLAQLHPKLNLDLSFSDRHVDLIRDGVDAVVRIGHLADSTLVARPLAQQQILTMASPDYLDRHGTPRKPADLADHICLLFRMPSTHRVRPWQFRHRGEAIEISPANSYVLDEGEAVIHAAACGLGLAQAPSYMAEPELDRGRLVEVLPAWRPAALPISLVFPSTRFLTPRMRAVIKAFEEGVVHARTKPPTKPARGTATLRRAR